MLYPQWAYKWQRQQETFGVRNLWSTDVCTAFQDSFQERLARDCAVPKESVESIDLEWSGISEYYVCDL